VQHHTIEATLKSFSASRRFGFLVPEPGAGIDGEVLIHESVLEGHPDAAIPGARLSCTVARLPDGARVVQVLTCRPPEAFTVARVKWFSIRKAFGFLEDGTGEDIFLHVSVAVTAGFTSLPPQLALRVLAKRCDRGRYAIVVRPIDSTVSVLAK
jgi:cold shock CspA family protein